MLLLGAAAGSAFAKCEGTDPPAFCDEVMANIDFGSAGASLRAGTESPVRIWLFRGEQPLEISGVTLVFNRIADGTNISVEGRPSGTPGLWLSDVEMPAGGGWTVVVEAAGIDGTLERVSLTTVRVREPLTAPGDQPATPVAPTLPALPIALLVAGIAAAALFAPSLRQRSRERAPAA